MLKLFELLLLSRAHELRRSVEVGVLAEVVTHLSGGVRSECG